MIYEIFYHLYWRRKLSRFLKFPASRNRVSKTIAPPAGRAETRKKRRSWLMIVGSLWSEKVCHHHRALREWNRRKLNCSTHGKSFLRASVPWRDSDELLSGRPKSRTSWGWSRAIRTTAQCKLSPSTRRWWWWKKYFQHFRDVSIFSNWWKIPGVNLIW